MNKHRALYRFVNFAKTDGKIQTKLTVIRNTNYTCVLDTTIATEHLVCVNYGYVYSAPGYNAKDNAGSRDIISVGSNPAANGTILNFNISRTL